MTLAWLAVTVAVEVAVAVFVVLLTAVFVTVVEAGPLPIRQEQADEMALGLLRPAPREMLIPRPGRLRSS